MLCLSFILYNQRGKGGKIPLFCHTLRGNEASSASLEALIATLLPASGTAKEVTFLTAIKLLIAVRSLFSCADGERATPISLRIDRRIQRVVVSVHFPLHADDEFPSNGNTRLP